jgi:ribosome-binding protein aMBF1 (putative translation factor)
MSAKHPRAQRRRHETVEQEFHKRHWSLGEIQQAESVSLAAYQILEEVLVGLRKKRTAEGLSLDDVARASGIDNAYLSRLENGKVANPTFETLYRYAVAITPIRSVRDFAPA